MFKTLLVGTDARGVVTLTLNRPEKRNALSALMLTELSEFAATTGQNATTRAVILQGAGDLFCAGGDLAWMQEQMTATRATRKAEARRLAHMLRDLNALPCPLIGRLHGSAFGGGVGLACVCDVAIAAADTKFGLTETRLGLIPATIGPYVIARMGEGRARRVFMSSRVFAADEAQELGIIAKSVSTVGLSDAVDAEVAPYLNCAPGAVKAAKALAQSLGPRIDDAIIDATIERLCDTWEGSEAAAGVAAFFAKTKAPWITK